MKIGTSRRHEWLHLRLTGFALHLRICTLGLTVTQSVCAQSLKGWLGRWVRRAAGASAHGRRAQATELLRLKEARKPVIVTGILPRAAANGEWYSRSLSANASVERLCSTMGLHFVDLWDEFYEHRDYYIRDGLHLSDKGASALGDAYLYVIQENQVGWGGGQNSKGTSTMSTN